MDEGRKRRKGDEGGGVAGLKHIRRSGSEEKETEDASHRAVLSHPLFQAIKGLDVGCDGWHRGPLTDCRELRCHAAESLQLLHSGPRSQMTGRSRAGGVGDGAGGSESGGATSSTLLPLFIPFLHHVFTGSPRSTAAVIHLCFRTAPQRNRSSATTETKRKKKEAQRHPTVCQRHTQESMEGRRRPWIKASVPLK